MSPTNAGSLSEANSPNEVDRLAEIVVRAGAGNVQNPGYHEQLKGGWDFFLDSCEPKNALRAETPTRTGSLKNGDEEQLMPAHAPLSKSCQSGQARRHEE